VTELNFTNLKHPGSRSWGTESAGEQQTAMSDNRKLEADTMTICWASANEGPRWVCVIAIADKTKVNLLTLSKRKCAMCLINLSIL